MRNGANLTDGDFPSLAKEKKLCRPAQVSFHERANFASENKLPKLFIFQGFFAVQKKKYYIIMSRGASTASTTEPISVHTIDM